MTRQMPVPVALVRNMRRRLQPFLKSVLPYVLLLLVAAGMLAWAQPAATLQTPGSPTNLAAAPGPNPGEVTLTWNPAAGTELHWVWSMKLDGTDYRWHQAPGDADSLVVTDLDAGEPYQFLLLAIFPPAKSNAPARWRFSNFASATPKVAPPPPNTAQAIAAGGKHTCMLQADGIAACWGANGDADQGQADPPAGVVFTAITAGYEHTCALTAAGNARCWGYNGSGQSTAPAGVTFSHIDAGRAHTCAIRADNSAPQCWGSNEYGQRNAPRRRVLHRDNRRRRPQLRPPRRRAGAVLGRQLLPPVHAARRAVLRRQRGRVAHLRHQAGRQHRLLGREPGRPGAGGGGRFLSGG